ncbi:MAG: low affinity iron permease family protein [Myxococcales bacterium]
MTSGPRRGNGNGGGGWFRALSYKVSSCAGSYWAFIAAAGLVILWLVTGPIFHFSDSWQLVINTGTTIITFLMVFLIQSTQNRDGKAIQLKLDELIRSSRARNVFAALEDADEDEIKRFEEEFRELREKGLPGHHAVREAARRTHDEED